MVDAYNKEISRLTVTDDPTSALASALARERATKVAVVTDSNVKESVMPMFAPVTEGCETIVIPAGEENKNPQMLMEVWRRMSACGLTRRDLLINIGGGVVTDLGGFAAATFKRGMRHINVATTLLGAVDAAAGGKTGIDLDGLKNEVGAFRQPVEVIVSAKPFSSLPRRELLSGYAEMVKTALISDHAFYQQLLDTESVLRSSANLEDAMRRCVMEKMRIVESDPEEKGLRKVLNLGHTAGHAIETLSHEKGEPLTHGASVAFGLAVTLSLSCRLAGLPSGFTEEYIAKLLTPVYGFPHATDMIITSVSDIDRLIDLMGHDKKNVRAGNPAFVLISEPGKPLLDIHPSSDILRSTLTDLFQHPAGQ